MDADYWVPLDLILTFPRMVRLGVTDKSRVANLLHARSPDIEVDHATARIRPAWALRSNLVLRDVHPSATDADLAAILKIPFANPPPADTSSPSYAEPVEHFPGLMSVLQVADTVWVAIFESQDAAAEALPLVDGKNVRGEPISAQVYFEGLQPHNQSYSPDVFQAIPNPYGSAPPPPQSSTSTSLHSSIPMHPSGSQPTTSAATGGRTDGDVADTSALSSSSLPHVPSHYGESQRYSYPYGVVPYGGPGGIDSSPSASSPAVYVPPHHLPPPIPDAARSADMINAAASSPALGTAARPGGLNSSSPSPSGRGRARSYNDVRAVAPGTRVNGHRIAEQRRGAAYNNNGRTGGAVSGGRAGDGKDDQHSNSPSLSAPTNQGNGVSRRPRRNPGVRRAANRHSPSNGRGAANGGAAVTNAQAQPVVVAVAPVPDVTAMNFPPLSSMSGGGRTPRSGASSPSATSPGVGDVSKDKCNFALPVISGFSDAVTVTSNRDVVVEAKVERVIEKLDQVKNKGNVSAVAAVARKVGGPKSGHDGSAKVEVNGDGDKDELELGGPGSTSNGPSISSVKLSPIVAAPKSYAAILKAKPAMPQGGGRMGGGGGKVNGGGGMANGVGTKSGHSANGGHKRNGPGVGGSVGNENGKAEAVSGDKSVSSGNGSDGEKGNGGYGNTVAKATRRPPKSPGVWACKPASVVKATGVVSANGVVGKNGLHGKVGHGHANSGLATARSGRGAVNGNGGSAVSNGTMGGRASHIRQGGTTATTTTTARAVVG